MTTSRADVSGDMDARVGRLVHQMMWDKRLTQTTVAARLGIQQSALSKKLRGDRGWSVQELVTLAQLLDTTSSYLLGETDDSTRPQVTGGDDPNDGGTPVTGKDDLDPPLPVTPIDQAWTPAAPNLQKAA